MPSNTSTATPVPVNQIMDFINVEMDLYNRICCIGRLNNFLPNIHSKEKKYESFSMSKYPDFQATHCISKDKIHSVCFEYTEIPHLKGTGLLREGAL